MTRSPEDLIGKTVSFHVLATTGNKSRYSGSRQGKVVRVDNGPRKGFIGATILTPAPGNGKLTQYIEPKRIRVTIEELSATNHPTGVLWFGKLRPLAEWLRS